MRLNEGGSVAKHELEGLWLVFAGNVQVSRGRELHQLVAGDAFRPVGVKSTVWMCRALGPSTLLYLTPIKVGLFRTLLCTTNENCTASERIKS